MSHHPERTARNVRPVNQPPSIKYVFITHNHEDHFGGLLTLLRMPNINVEKVFLLEDAVYYNESKEDFKELLYSLAEFDRIEVVKNPGIGTVHIEAGLRLVIKHPSVGLLDKPPANPNVSSMVITLEKDSKIPFTCVLWGGDAKLGSVASVCANNKPTIMMGPHHGKPQEFDRSGNFREQLKKIGPERTFLSFGRINSHKHPCRDYIVGARLSGIKVYCSEVAKCCAEECDESVFEGNGMLGINTSPDMIQCRGSMRLVFSVNNPLGEDPFQDLFDKAVTEKVLTPKCRANT